MTDIYQISYTKCFLVFQRTHNGYTTYRSRNYSPINLQSTLYFCISFASNFRVSFRLHYKLHSTNECERKQKKSLMQNDLLHACKAFQRHLLLARHSNMYFKIYYYEEREIEKTNYTSAWFSCNLILECVYFRF